ncbi:MAG: cell division protein ZapA [Cyclonatronaceae bacterium]
MKSIKVSILGRQYPLRVNEADVDMMYDIATYVDDRFRSFKKELINQNDTTIMVLACLSIAEDYFVAKNQSDGSGNAGKVPTEINSSLNELLAEIKSLNHDIT